MCNRHPHIGTQ